MATDFEILKQADAFRKSGNGDLAGPLYDHLLAKEPSNTVFIFSKALNEVSSNPNLALNLFEKVVDLNPSATETYLNIAILSIQTQQFERGIDIISRYLEQNPDDMERVFERALVIANSGDSMRALLEFYNIVESSNLKDDPNVFIRSKVAENIALAKVELRNQTSQKIIEPHFYAPYKESSFIEFHYELPKKLFGSENYYFTEGKYKDESITSILYSDPEYLNSCIINYKYFSVSEEIMELLKLQGIDTSMTEIINSVKLNLQGAADAMESLEEYPEFYEDDDDDEDEDGESSIHFVDIK